MQKNTAELHSSLSSINEMSLCEIQCKWAGIYNYHNFVTNYKRLQKKDQMEPSPSSIDSNNPDNTLLNCQFSAKKFSRK